MWQSKSNAMLIIKPIQNVDIAGATQLLAPGADGRRGATQCRRGATQLTALDLIIAETPLQNGSDGTTGTAF